VAGHQGKLTGKSGSVKSIEQQCSTWQVAMPVGIATTVTMWSAGYCSRLPFVMAPPWLLFFALIAILILSGRVAAGRCRQRWSAALLSGAITGVVDLLVVGSWLLPEDSSAFSLVLMASGFVLVCMGLSACGAATAAAGTSTGRRGVESMTRTAFWATLMLIGIGGLVTSEEAGMAVPDWPGSFGNNMFLLPLSRMTGGIYYEHAHRLFGSLVGLVTLSTAFYCWRVAPDRTLSGLGLLASVQVVVQGVLGGYRVTGAESVTVVSGQVAESVESTFSLVLRVVHGVHGQVFLAVLAVMATLASSAWNDLPRPVHRRSWQRWSGWLVLLLTGQLLLGALSRHISRSWVMTHLVTGLVMLALVFFVSSLLGSDTSSKSRTRLALGLVFATILQVSLGFMTLALTGTEVRAASSGISETLTATAHQTLGGVILSLAVVLHCWCRRSGPPAKEDAALSHDGSP